MLSPVNRDVNLNGTKTFRKGTQGEEYYRGKVRNSNTNASENSEVAYSKEGWFENTSQK